MSKDFDTGFQKQNNIVNGCIDADSTADQFEGTNNKS